MNCSRQLAALFLNSIFHTSNSTPQSSNSRLLILLSNSLPQLVSFDTLHFSIFSQPFVFNHQGTAQRGRGRRNFVTHAPRHSGPAGRAGFVSALRSLLVARFSLARLAIAKLRSLNPLSSAVTKKGWGGCPAGAIFGLRLRIDVASDRHCRPSILIPSTTSPTPFPQPPVLCYTGRSRNFNRLEVQESWQ